MIVLKLVSSGGYAPPGSVVAQNLVPVPNDPSGNYAS
jgi:hypothetical protein